MRLSWTGMACAVSVDLKTIASHIGRLWRLLTGRRDSDLLDGAPRRLISPLMIRILAVNAIALMTLGGGILYLNQFRTNLIQARIEQLQMQGDAIAAALGETAVSGPEASTLDVAPAREIIRRLAAPERVRARLFNTSGTMVADSRRLAADRILYEEDLQEASNIAAVDAHLAGLVHLFLDGFIQRDPAPPFVDTQGLRASDLMELTVALEGSPASMVRQRMAADGSLGGNIINVAVPVQRFRRVLGALLMTVETDEIEVIVRAEQLQIMRIFSAAFALTVLLSFFLGRTLVRPIRILARAAERVRRGRGREESIPEFATRSDEIGDLSRSLSEMTRALYNQIDAVERFAADVAHEIKNPLTSMQSALETLERAEDPSIRDRLMAILRDDVRRMDRLISDISDASRLDAELTRGAKEPIDLQRELYNLVGAYKQARLPETVTLVFRPDTPQSNPPNGRDSRNGRRDGGTSTGTASKETSDAGTSGSGTSGAGVSGSGASGSGTSVSATSVSGTSGAWVAGVSGRLNQVWRNLIDNALSFSPQGSAVTVTLKRQGRQCVVAVADQGPGLPDQVEDKIFKRFYSERPESEAFGNHSGLGLAISRQIIEAHGGRISAENRLSAAGEIEGARFTVILPTVKAPPPVKADVAKTSNAKTDAMKTAGSRNTGDSKDTAKRTAKGGQGDT